MSKATPIWIPGLLSLVACGNGGSSAARMDAGDAQTQLADVAQNVPADSSPGPATTDGGSSAPTDGASPVDATVATITAPFFRGSVSVSYAALNGGSSYSYTAYFEEVTDPACTERQEEACSILRCDRAADGGPLAIALESAGPIRLSWGDAGAFATITPDAGYQDLIPPIGPFSTGDMLTLTASGGDVPAFSAHVAFPQQIQLEDASRTIPVTQGYRIAWTGVDGWLVRVDIRETTSDRDVRVLCDVPGDAGSALVPPAALSDLEVVTFTPSGNHGDIEVFATSITQVDAGGYPVTIVTRQGGGISGLPQLQ